MLSNDFLENRHCYHVSAVDMDAFLKECEEEGLMWYHGKRPTEFDPIRFYEGENIRYLAPIQKVEDRSKVYVKCFDGRLYFSFCYDWTMQPMREYEP